MAPTVLICDDQEVLRTLVRLSLPDGYRFVELAHGDRVLETARRVRPDLIVLDLMMPGQGGLPVLAELRADPELRSTPVVVLTVLGQARDREAAVEAGADRYLVKPFSPADLAAVAEELLARTPATGP